MVSPKPPIPPRKPLRRSTQRVRHVMNAYLNAPIETRHLAAQQADQEFHQKNPRPSQSSALTAPTPKTPEKQDPVSADSNKVWAGVTKTFQENPDYEVPY